MRVVEQSHRIVGEAPRDFAGVCRTMEAAARICYASEDRITEDSAVPFLNKIIANGHTSVLAMSGVVGGMATLDNATQILNDLSWPESQDLTKYLDISEDGMFAYGSIRAFHNIFSKCKTINELWSAMAPDQDAEIPMDLRRVAVEFHTSRSTGNQLVRHSVASFLQSSQRYIDHSYPAMILPTWFIGKQNSVAYDDWERGQESACDLYRTMRDYGVPQQHARSVLPNATETTIMVMMRVKDWKRMLKIRTAKDADPNMINLVEPVVGYFEDNY